MVEFALVLPLFMLFTLIAVDFGRVYFSYVQITNAAREGANFGSVSPTDNSGIQAKALQETNAQSQGGEGGVTIPAPERRSPEYLARYIPSEIEKWAGPIKASGVPAD